MGIKLRFVNPRFTSRRCSKCGFIDVEFDHRSREAQGSGRRRARFKCPEPGCDYEADPDYNAARNLATLDIEKLIAVQCKRQGLEPDAL